MLRRYKIHGHSMEPYMLSGSSVLVLKTKRVKPRDVIAFRYQNNEKDVMVKRIVTQTDENTFTVDGDNKDDSLAVPAVCRDEIIGKVVLHY